MTVGSRAGGLRGFAPPSLGVPARVGQAPGRGGMSSGPCGPPATGQTAPQVSRRHPCRHDTCTGRCPIRISYRTLPLPPLPSGTPSRSPRRPSRAAAASAQSALQNQRFCKLAQPGPGPRRRSRGARPLLVLLSKGVGLITVPPALPPRRPHRSACAPLRGLPNMATPHPTLCWGCNGK